MERMVVPVGSGKGGVGKSVFTANLGIALARRGKTVVLVDLDFGGSNLHTCLGVRNTHAGIGRYVHKREERFDALLVPTDIPRLFFIPGDGLLPETANLNYSTKQKIIREVCRLTADVVLLDLGAGTAYNTLDLFLASNTGIVITTPEITSILNAYAFLKAAIFRLIVRSFPRGSPARNAIRALVAEGIEGKDVTLPMLVDHLGEVDSEHQELARSRLRELHPKAVLNMARTKDELRVGTRLREISRRNLGISPEYIGVLPEDVSVPQAIAARTACAIASPECEYCSAVERAAQNLIRLRQTESPVLYEGDEDLHVLNVEQDRADV